MHVETVHNDLVHNLSYLTAVSLSPVAANKTNVRFVGSPDKSYNTSKF
jgi:hypothetical protein